MKKISLFFVFLMMSALAFTAVAENLRGDCNQDGSVSIDDVTAMIDYLLTNNPNGLDLTATDCNLDGIISIDDVTSLIDYLLTSSWPEAEDPHDYVDLGLPSGTLWATCNVGASRPEEYGNYYAWGETVPKDYYDFSTYLWTNNYGELTKYCNDSYWGVVDNKLELDPEDDAAYANWGSSWRMPTTQQQSELINNCSRQWTTMNGVNGTLLTGPNGNTLFLPAAGSFNYSELESVGVRCNFWSRSLATSINAGNAFYMYFKSNGRDTWYLGRPLGLTVRAVRVPQN